VRRDRLRQLKDREHAFFDIAFLKAMRPEDRSACVDLLDLSKSQIRQDLFALAHHRFKRGGFFVEFGATDGVSLNNSWLMEKEFGWSGILAEPARRWHEALRKNRSAAIDTRCVWSRTGEKLHFTEAPRGENSAISTFVSKSRRIRGTGYEVETVSLNDLLAEHGAPPHIDFLSVDTEGSEFDILETLDWDHWSFGAISVEHNHAPQREDIHALLTAQGYERVLTELSNFDDWYVTPA
jgi:FkbM family methyltransferase